MQTTVRRKLQLWSSLIFVAGLGWSVVQGASPAPREPATPHESAPAPGVMPSRSLPGLQQGNAPWPAERSQLRARLAAIGLPALPEEGNALHTHQHLDIFINGAAVPVPSEIGIDPEERFIAPLHTHDATGIIHVESPTVQTYTLGQFFDVWGVRFTATCIGGYCAHDEVSLRVFVNGQLVAHDPRQIALAPHQEIVVTSGSDATVPHPLPSHYVFPPGL